MTRLVHADNRYVLVEKLSVREDYWGRLRGLMFLRKISSGSGMLLVGTKRVHTFGMLFSIDLYFFDSSMRLIDFLFNVLPCRIPSSPSGTCYILELAHTGNDEKLRIEKGEQASIIWKVQQ